MDSEEFGRIGPLPFSVLGGNVMHGPRSVNLLLAVLRRNQARLKKLASWSNWSTAATILALQASKKLSPFDGESLDLKTFRVYPS